MTFTSGIEVLEDFSSGQVSSNSPNYVVPFGTSRVSGKVLTGQFCPGPDMYRLSLGGGISPSSVLLNRRIR